jgi:hypothetical protein
VGEGRGREDALLAVVNRPIEKTRKEGFLTSQTPFGITDLGFVVVL